MASELDAYLGRGPLMLAPAEETDDPWLLMAKSDPSAWRKRGNPYTQRIAEMIAADAMLPLEGSVGRDVRKVSVRLLEELGPELAEEAIQECRRKEGKWRSLNIWVMAKLIVHAGARMKGRKWFTQHLDDDPIVEPREFPCPKCHQVCYNERVLDFDCSYHFLNRKDYYAWKGEA